MNLFKFALVINNPKYGMLRTIEDIEYLNELNWRKRKNNMIRSENIIAIIMPLIALVISTIFEGLKWDLSLYIGASLVIFGNILILKKN